MKKCFFKNVVDNALSIPDDKKISENSFKIRMAMSFIGIIACMTLMLSSAFALFYADVRSDNSTISGAYFAVSVSNAQDGTYECPLTYEDRHTFVITAEGTASSGYCKITVGDDEYFTPQIPVGTSLTVEIIAKSGTVVTFEGSWGAPSINEEGELYVDGIAHSSTEFATYTVKAGATLEALSAYYGVPASDIVDFNAITELVPDQVIKIPNVASDTPEFTLEPDDDGENIGNTDKKDNTGNTDNEDNGEPDEPSADEEVVQQDGESVRDDITDEQDQQQSDTTSDTENEDEQPDSVE